MTDVEDLREELRSIAKVPMTKKCSDAMHTALVKLEQEHEDNRKSMQISQSKLKSVFDV